MNDTRNQEARARRAVKRVGLKARKSRWRAGSVDNFGEFMIIEPRGNYVVAGSRFDCTADDVVEFCAKHEVAADRKCKKGPFRWQDACDLTLKTSVRCTRSMTLSRSAPMARPPG